jgi:hypothetical protein
MFTSAAGRNVRMAIYGGGSNNLPSSLLGSTASFATAAGAIEAPLASPVTLASGTYWIAAISDADLTMSMSVTAGGAGYALTTNPAGWNTMPNPFTPGGSNNAGETPDFYVALEAQ